jgi:large subunit ribosomal protein L10
MPRPDKAAAVAELTEEFRTSSAAVLTEYRGLSVAQLKALRTALGRTTSYAVVKNTLTKIAARDAGVEGVEEHLSGPSAIAFVKGDVVEAARGLRDFARTNPHLVIKGGVLDGRPITADEIRTLADLEPRDVLLAKLAGALKASLTNAVSLFAAPLAQTARLLEALRQKAELDPSILAGGAGTPAEPVAEDVSPVDEPVAEVAEDVSPEDEPVAEVAAEVKPVADVSPEDEPVAEVAAEVEPVAEVAAEVEPVDEPTPAATDEPNGDTLVEVAEIGEPEITEAEITDPQAIQALAEEIITPAEAASASEPDRPTDTPIIIPQG